MTSARGVPLRDHVDNLSKTANDIGYRPEAVIEHGKNITYARQNLNKVVEARKTQ